MFCTENSSLNAPKSQHDKTNRMASVPSEDSDQPGHLPSLIRIFALCLKKVWVLIRVFALCLKKL